MPIQHDPNWRTVVREDVECEGFDYAFVNYDDYKWIEDEGFQAALTAFREARASLARVVGVDPDSV